jgi:hypothetical protein
MGCIHAVLTVQKDFLITIDFTTSSSSTAYVTLLDVKYDQWRGNASQDKIFDNMLRSVQIGLHNNRKQEALGAWLKCEQQITQYGLKNRS